MNLQLFSIFGYASVLLWVLVPLLWLVHSLRRPRGWLCHVAVVVALAAWLCALINSFTYVNRIQIDRSEEIAAKQAKLEAARRLAEEARGGEVAQVRFAEDSATDYLDEGGMDDADLKYMSTFDQDAAPEWKKEKKTRSQTAGRDDSLEAMLDTSAEKEEGVASKVLDAEAAAPIMMPEKQFMLANRLDAVNLKLAFWLFVGAIVVVLMDYLRRANVYEDAYLPLPIPSAWVKAFTPMPENWSHPESPRRDMLHELKWLVRRGDTFLYLTDKAGTAAAIPTRLPRLPLTLAPFDVLHVSDAEPLVDDPFIFEGLWYNRGSFVVSSRERAEALLAHLVQKLRGRKETRAKVKQTVHLVWGFAAPMPESIRAELAPLAEKAGWSLLERGGQQASTTAGSSR